jgi:hypothetical protein
MSGVNSRLIHWLAIVLIVEIGLLHILNAQAEFEEAAYMGYLFAANFFGALIAAWGIYRRQLLGWLLGLVIASGAIAGYIWSRTLGMPGMKVEEWFTPYGIVAMTLEGVYLLLVMFRPWRIRGDAIRSTASAALRYSLPSAGLLIIASISILSYRWDLSVTQAFGHHVGSLVQVCDTPVTTFSELEQQYGIQMLQAATSMMGSIIDVRVRIIDPDKAQSILQNQSALLVDQQALILAPHMHAHTGNRLKAGKVFVVFFPTQQKVHVGSEVSLVFGSTRIQPVIVK